MLSQCLIESDKAVAEADVYKRQLQNMVLNLDILILFLENFINSHESNSVRFVESNPLSSIYINTKRTAAAVLFV